ncbi:MAG: TolC family protein [Cystobacter sp.]
MARREAFRSARTKELAAEVREAFGRALAAERVVHLAEAAANLAEEARRATEQRLEAGTASRIEVNTTRGELGRARRDESHHPAAECHGIGIPAPPHRPGR